MKKKSAPKKYNRKLTSFLTLAPMSGIVISLLLSLFITAIFGSMGINLSDSTGSLKELIFLVLQFVISLFALLCVVGVLTATPYGIYRYIKSGGSGKEKIVKYGKLRFIPNVQFKSTAKLFRVIIALAVLLILTYIFVIVVAILIIMAISNPELLSTNVISFLQTFNYNLLAILQVFIAMLLGVISLQWTARSYKNLYAWDIKTHTTPAWTVGYYFIPILNFYKPYQNLKEIWLQSGGKKNFTPIILLLWLVSLFAYFFDRYTAYALKDAPPEEAKFTFIIVLISTSILMVSAVFGILVMRKITKLQDAKALAQHFHKAKDH